MKKIFFALTAALLIISCTSSSNHNVSLFKGFVNPAREYKPWCYWWWLNGHVDKETMSADLESMKDLGFGGVVMCGDLWNRFSIHHGLDFKDLISHFQKLQKAVN